MNKAFTIGEQIFKGCLRARSLSLVAFFLVALIGFMSMVGSSDSAHRMNLMIDSGLSLINIFGLFLVGLIILPVFANEKERHTLAASLSFDVSRTNYIWGLWIGCSAALLVNYLAMSVILIADLAFLGVNIDFGVFRQLFLNFIELLTFGSFAIAVSVFFSYAVSAMLCTAIYIVGHMTISFQMALSAWEGTIVGKFLDFMGYLIPDLSLFSIKDLVVKGTDIPITYELAAIIYALSLVFIAMEIARFKLNRESLM
jgi:ABC-type transport system involved in multi-copper enzyme maturation permease subunit